MEFFNMEVPLWLVIAYYVFMSVVSGMPTPGEKDGKGYIWLFGTLHALSANFERARVGFAKGGQNGTIIGGQAMKPPRKEGE